MTLSEAVKAAGIGGRVVRRSAADSEYPYAATSEMKAMRGLKYMLTFEQLIADDWEVVQRAPREWWLCLGGERENIASCVRVLRDEDGHDHRGRTVSIRVREVVE